MKGKSGQAALTGIIFLIILVLGAEVFLIAKFSPFSPTGKTTDNHEDNNENQKIQVNGDSSSPLPQNNFFIDTSIGGGGHGHHKDRIAPVIILNGEEEITIQANSVYIDAGATATDDADGDLTSEIVVAGNVETSVAGTYILTYYVEDSSGNAATATRTVNVDYLIEKETIIKTANRIITLQDSSGSWDWDVTDATGPTGTIYLNIAGITADIFLDAYELTENTTYLDAAKETGDYIVAQISALPDEQIFNAFNIVFLQRLSDLSEDNTYSNFAVNKMHDLINHVSYWKDVSHPICGGDGSGCTAQEIIEADEDVIRSWSTKPSGIVVWDMYHFIETAQIAGETGFANDLAEEIDNYMNRAEFNDTIDYYELGLSAGIIGLNNAGMDYSNYLEDLISKQNEDGSFGGSEPIQTTAYALIALSETGEFGAAQQASDYLVDNFGYDNIDGWLEDTTEYSEVTSEAGQAIYRYISLA